MKEASNTLSSSEIRKNLISGAIAGGMLGAALGFGWGSLWLGIVVGVLFGLAIGFRLGRAPIKMRFPMYMIRRMLLAAAFTMLAGLVYAILLDRGWTGTPLHLVALIPLAGWVVLVVFIGAAISSLDELQRRIQTEAIAIGFAGTAIVCGGIGLLGIGGLLPSWNWGLVVFVMVFMWFLGKMWTMWRYR